MKRNIKFLAIFSFLLLILFGPTAKFILAQENLSTSETTSVSEGSSEDASSLEESSTENSSFEQERSTSLTESNLPSEEVSTEPATSEEVKANKPEMRTRTISTPPNAGRIVVENLDNQSGTFDIVITDVSSSEAIKTVKVPVWTSAGGQDDLKWYVATKQNNGTYRVNINRKNHKNEFGEYTIHLYYELASGSMRGVANAKVVLQNSIMGSIQIANQNNQLGTFDIITDVSSSEAIKTVKVPVWTSAGGQDDLKWYVATKQSDGSYRVNINRKNHKNEFGEYTIHLYYELVSGSMKGVANAKTSLTNIVTGSIRVENINYKSGSFDIIITNVSSSETIKTVKVPVWTSAGGQDDLKWYVATKQPNGNYKLSIDAKNHKYTSGEYVIHLYYEFANGSQKGVNNAKTSLSNQNTGAIKIEKSDKNTGNFEVVVSQISAVDGLQSVLVPIWSDTGGQDDLVWYEAKREANGNYRVKVESGRHKYSIGLYNIHLYYRTVTGKRIGVGSSQHSVQIQQSRGTANLSISSVNNQRGTFDVTVSNIFAPRGIKEIQVPVWTDARGQDDIRWYRANRQANGTYKVTISVANHGYRSGLYHVHSYLVPINGNRNGLGATTVQVNYQGLVNNGNFYSIQGKYASIPIVNKKYPVNRYYNPGENPTAKAAFDRLTNKMRSLGFGISYSYSGFRSYSTQQALYWNYVNQYGQAEADRFSARPGYSEHQIGLAFDVLGSGGGLLSQPDAVAWLASHAHEYGFIVRYKEGKEGITGYMAEPWHIRYIGDEARDIYQSGLTLEEYFGIKGGGY